MIYNRIHIKLSQLYKKKLQEGATSVAQTYLYTPQWYDSRPTGTHTKSLNKKKLAKDLFLDRRIQAFAWNETRPINGRVEKKQ